MKPLLPHPKPKSPTKADKLRASMERRRERKAASAKRYADEVAEARRKVAATDPGFTLLEPGGPLPETNPERLKKLREEQYAIASGYHRWVMDQPCAACGSWDSELRSDPAHVGRTKGAGAKADHVLSLCRLCHVYEGEHRDEFNESFRERHGVLPVEMAMYRHEVYHRELES